MLALKKTKSVLESDYIHIHIYDKRWFGPLTFEGAKRTKMMDHGLNIKSCFLSDYKSKGAPIYMTQILYKSFISLANMALLYWSRNKLGIV